MMPRVQFTQASDGQTIAFAELGQGPPLVLMPALPFSHLEKLWELPAIREGIEALASRWTVIRYDNRGCGLSERDVDDFSIDAHVRDLEAVVDKLELDSFALNAPLLAGPIAIAYAARHPERLRHLILQSTVASSAAVRSAQTDALLSLAEQDWTLYTETAARVLLQWGDEDLSRQAAPVLRECVTREAGLALLRASLEFDVTGLLAQVRTSTLVIHNRGLPIDATVARDLASQIPNARLAAVDGFADVIPAAVEFLLGERARARTSGEVASSSPADTDPAGLSRRELEVLRLIAAGRSNRDIAEELVISRNTVDRHVSHILAKIGAANRAEAAAYAAKQRLLS
jgi:pimeloyl-ACP methyl ester carboxylesterase/DNA-binding CsgD family transcriptional regulator